MQELGGKKKTGSALHKNYHVPKNFSSSLREAIWEFRMKEVESSSWSIGLEANTHALLLALLLARCVA